MSDDNESVWPNLKIGEKSCHFSDPSGAALPPRLPSPDTAVALPVEKTPSLAIGDYVLAPIDPTFLHIGMVCQINEGSAQIEFIDGTLASIAVESLRAASLQEEQKVFCRRSEGASVFYHPATVREVDGEQVTVLLDGPDEEVTLNLDSIAVSRQPWAPYLATLPGLASDDFFAGLKCGDSVWAPWDTATLYPARVSRIQGEDVHVDYGENYWAWVKRAQLLPLEFPVGMKAFARWQHGAQYHPCEVVAEEQGQIRVRYMDDSEEWLSPGALAVTRIPFGPAAFCSRTPEDAAELRYYFYYFLFLVALLIFFALRW